MMRRATALPAACAQRQRAAGLVAQAAALLELAPRPTRDSVRSARRLYMEAWRCLEPATNPQRTPSLRRVARRVDALLFRARMAATVAACLDWLVARPLPAALSALLAVSLAAVIWVHGAHPNQLVGHPFTLSSEWAKCQPKRGLCGGSATHVFFHTNEESSPFIRYDLEHVAELSHLEVTNRLDSGLEDRAVPLVVETSLNGSDWHELVRREYWFDIWRADFARTRARYLRLTVPRRSVLHLDGVRAW